MNRRILALTLILTLTAAMIVVTMTGCSARGNAPDQGANPAPGGGTSSGGGSPTNRPVPGFKGTSDFPLDRQTMSLDLGDGLWMLERTGPPSAYEKSYWFWYTDKAQLQEFIGLAETATFDRREGQLLIFRARGGDDTGNYRFPYEVVFDLATGTQRSRSIFLPLSTQVDFGKASWDQVVASSLVTGNGFTIGFAPRPGEVLAGGHCLPQTTSTYDEKAGVLTLTFRNVGVGDDFNPGKAIAPETPGLVKSMTIERDGADVRVLAALGGPAVWNAQTMGSLGTGAADIVGCVVTFKAAP